MARQSLSRPAALLAGLLASALGVLVLGPAEFSTAAYVARTTSTATVSAAADWTPPTVSVLNPGAAVKGTSTVVVEASDATSGVASVALEALGPHAAEWVSICTDTVAPLSCDWNTAGLIEGSWALRARAVDGAGYAATSAVVRTTVANRLMVTLDSPGDAVRGSVPLSAGVFNVGSVNHTVRIEYAVSDSTSWRTLCSNLSAPYTCTWNTTGSAFTAGNYDLRAVLVAGGTTTYSDVVEEVEVDNQVPVVSMSSPANPLSGPVTFAATATDTGSGVDTVTLQAARSGSTTWSELCSRDTEPFSCRFDTAQLAEGSWQFRAVAVDAAGNSATSTAVGPRTVDNTIASIVLDSPSAFTGTVTLGATATSSAGVGSVKFQYAASGSSTWVDLCTDTASPWACTWNTASVKDGSYDLRAVMTDTQGRVTISPVDAGNVVDNSPLRGVDVQSTNGGASAGKPDAGDTITFTYSGVVDTTKLITGWNGTARSVTARFRDGALVARSGREDAFDVLSGSTVVGLGSVNLKSDQVKTLRSASLNATMTAQTITTETGIQRTVVTVRLNATSSRLRTLKTASTMVWTPSSAATDLQGRTSSTASVTESGPADREF